MTEKNSEKNMDEVMALMKRRGFVFRDSEIYGGLAGMWDYGPYGIELKNNIKNVWWRHFVHDRDDMYGIESSIIMNPKVWEASGHTSGFSDILIDCKACKNRFRADHLIEEATGTDVEGMSFEEINKIVAENKIPCPNCGKNDWTEVRTFNLLFKTHVGPIENEKTLAYLRGETAQGMFTNFKNILDSLHPKLPFGLAQIGRNFRNEISPGESMFRLREFEIAEFEYFIDPRGEWEPVFDDLISYLKDFYTKIGIDPEIIRYREIPDEKRAHYSKRTIDMEYPFPFGIKEIGGIAYRTDYDLKNHYEASGVDLRYYDQDANERFLPHVIEPTFGVDRTFLAVVVDAYTEDELGGEKRVYLKLKPSIAPIKIAVFPLLKNKPELVVKAQEVYSLLKKEIPQIAFDDNGNIGKRYRRQDEIGTPYCVTIDFDTLEDNTVTIRDRDTGEQERVAIAGLLSKITPSLA